MVSEFLTSTVLLLNQNYEPLNICTVRRAVCLLGLGNLGGHLARGNQLADVGGTFRGEPRPPPFKLLSKNPFKLRLVRELKNERQRDPN